MNRLPPTVSINPLLVPFLMRGALSPTKAQNDAERETQVDEILARAERLEAAAQALQTERLSGRHRLREVIGASSPSRVMGCSLRHRSANARAHRLPFLLPQG